MLNDVKISLLLAIALIVTMSYAYVLKGEVKNLEMQKAYCEASQENLQKAITLQNEEIEKLRIIEREPVKVNLSHIEVKENTIEAELEAYKQLFRELAK